MFKLFDRWDCTGIVVVDPALKDYISIKPMLVPRSSGRQAFQRFYKNKYPIVERLINRMMVPGHRGKKHYITSGDCGGKRVINIKILEQTFDFIEEKMKQNPLAVFVKAIENAAPRDEITTIEYGGARYPQAVDCSPQRRIDLALRMMVQGSYQKSFGKKLKMYEALANEIILAYQTDNKSTAIAKKIELERQADAAR